MELALLAIAARPYKDTYLSSSGHDDMSASRFQLFLEFKGDCQVDFFSPVPLATDRSGIHPAMSRIKHN